MKNSGKPLDNHTWHTNDLLQQKVLEFGFRTHITALWLMGQSSILSAKFDCPVPCQNLTFSYCAWLWNWLVRWIGNLTFVEVSSSSHSLSFLLFFDSHISGLIEGVTCSLTLWMRGTQHLNMKYEQNYKLIICWFYFNYEKIGLLQQWVTCSPETFFCMMLCTRVWCQ